ncbi:MAG: hypothetical protein LLG20_25775 [Acidobacteriales bacterium]|nr:hypothetical protein [Terriglobales bacterium]
MASGRQRLAHGWSVACGPDVSATLVREFVRPAVRALPSTMARRLGCCRIFLRAAADSSVTSQWTETEVGLDVSVMTGGCDDHDAAMELLLCFGQALWLKLSDAELRAYWNLLDGELTEEITGEIDEQALEEKHALLAGIRRRLGRYGGASFAGTAAEYVHCLWHDVTIRTGRDYLPAPQLRRRLELLARWFPPDRGYRLFPVEQPVRRQGADAPYRCGVRHI